MKTFSLALLMLLSTTSFATLYPEAAPCNPSPFGTFCKLHPEMKPTKKSQQYAYCGRTYVAISQKQRDVLNAYLKENKNVVLRFKLHGEFINAPCF
jgi:hypothetical protein